MQKRVWKALNVALLLAVGLSLGHMALWAYQLRPRPPIEGLVPIECGEILIGGQANYLAVLSRELIMTHGGLAPDSRELTRAIADRAKELGYKWPGDFRINPAGEICDCFGQRFQISVGVDRVTVTSPSLLTYYFAGFKSPSSVK